MSFSRTALLPFPSISGIKLPNYAYYSADFCAFCLESLRDLMTRFRQNTPFATSIFGKILGQINIFFWGLCVYSHLFISINRFLTITFPMKVSSFYSSSNFNLNTASFNFYPAEGVGHFIPLITDSNLDDVHPNQALHLCPVGIIILPCDTLFLV